MKNLLKTDDFIKGTLAYTLIVGLQLIFLYPLHKIMDLPVGDEAWYMYCGRNFSLNITKLGNVSWAPAYKFLYSVIARYSSAIESVFFMKYLLTIAVALLLAVFLYKALRSYSLSILLSLLWIASFQNYFTHVRFSLGLIWMVHHFALFIFLLALIFCKKARLISVLLLFLLSVFVRVEYSFILVPYLAYLSVIFIRKKRIENFLPLGNLTNKIFSVSIVMSLLILLFYIGINIESWDIKEKAWTSFIQSYAMRRVGVSMIHNPFQYFTSGNSIEYITMEQDFPGANYSLLKAFLLNPAMFISYLWKNAVDLPRQVLNIISLSYLKLFFIIKIVASAFLIFCLFYINLKKFKGELKHIIYELGDIFALALFSFFALFQGLIIYHTSTHFLILMPSILLFLGILYKAALNASNHKLFLKRSLDVVLFVIIALVLMGPLPYRLNSNRPNYSALSKLIKIWPPNKIKLLNIYGWQADSFCEYLGYEKCEIMPLDLNPVIKKPLTQLDLALYSPDAIIIKTPFLTPEYFDYSLLELLNSNAWKIYEISDDAKIYFKN